MEEKKDEQLQEAEELYLKAQQFENNNDYENAVDYYRQAADLGCADALLKLAHMYIDENNDDVETDVEKAIAYYKRAAKLGNSEALNELGCLYYDGKLIEQDFKKAVNYFKRAAEVDNVNAIYNLGRCYYLGDGVPIDVEISAEYYRKAAEMGDSMAMYKLGYMYKYGIGVHRDMNECMLWYRKASEAGCVQAGGSSGIIYYKGYCDVEKDYSQALSLLEKASKKGSLKAQRQLAMIFEEGHILPKDVQKSQHYYKKSLKMSRDLARQGDAFAFYMLGEYYYNGVPIIGLEKDYGQAVKWYLKAAKKGIEDAQNMLGVCYYYGLGVPKDYEESVYWYEQASKKDNVIALINLGKCYYIGTGVEKDYKQAAKCFRQAANNDYAVACYYYGKMCLKGEGVEQNFREAVYYLEKGCKGNYENTFAVLGNCYRNGWYVDKDEKKAFELYKQAADLGDLAAKVALAECYIEAIGTNVDLQQATCILNTICEEHEEYKKNDDPLLSKEMELGAILFYNPLDPEYLEHYAKAYYLLAKIYASGGDGVEKDTDKATRLLNIAENLGYKDTENSKYTISDLRKAIATNPESESLPLQGRLIVKKHMCHNKQFGLYNFIYKRADDTELTLKFSTKRSKFIYLMTVLSAKVGLPLRSTMFEELKDEMIQLTLDLGIQGPNESKTWVSKFYSDVDYKAGAYSTAGSNVNTCFKKNMTLQDYEICKLEQPGRGRNSVKTLGLSPDNIDVDSFFNDFMDAIQQVKKAKTTE